MAYSVDNLAPIVSSNVDAGSMYIYKEAATLATLRGSGYFDSSVDAGVVADDILCLVGSDGIGFSQVNVSGSTYTLDENITST